MATFKTYRIGRNYVTIDADTESPPLFWDEVFDVTPEAAQEIEAGAMPDEVVPEIAQSLQAAEGLE